LLRGPLPLAASGRVRQIPKETSAGRAIHAFSRLDDISIEIGTCVQAYG
jgi:hypothetical protein